MPIRAGLAGGLGRFYHRELAQQLGVKERRRFSLGSHRGIRESIHQLRSRGVRKRSRDGGDDADSAALPDCFYHHWAERGHDRDIHQVRVFTTAKTEQASPMASAPYSSQ